MIGIVDDDGVLVEEDRHGLRERHAVAAGVETLLRWIPFEAKITRHTYFMRPLTLVRRAISCGASPHAYELTRRRSPIFQQPKAPCPGAPCPTTTSTSRSKKGMPSTPSRSSRARPWAATCSYPEHQHHQGHPGIQGTGTFSARQILRASKFETSGWRGIASMCPVLGSHQSSCSLPCRLRKQPFRRKWRSSSPLSH